MASFNVRLFTYLAPSSCDRNRPPSSQVACKLTPFAPPFTQLSQPFLLPRTPTAQRLTTTTLGPLRSHYAEQLISWNRFCRPFSYIFLLQDWFVDLFFVYLFIRTHSVDLFPETDSVGGFFTYLFQRTDSVDFIWMFLLFRTVTAEAEQGI